MDRRRGRRRRSRGPRPARGPWNEADYRALGNSDFEKALGDGRVELIDGALVIGPGPTADDERAIAHTRAALDDALPDGLCVVGPVPLRMGPDCCSSPISSSCGRPTTPPSPTRSSTARRC